MSARQDSNFPSFIAVSFGICILLLCWWAATLAHEHDLIKLRVERLEHNTVGYAISADGECRYNGKTWPARKYDNYACYMEDMPR